MVDIVLKVTKPEMAVTSANTIYDCVLFRLFAPATTKLTVRDELGVEIGSMSIPGGFVEVMEKRKTDTVESIEPLLCSPLAYK
jgi:hypothetical protein